MPRKSPSESQYWSDVQHLGTEVLDAIAVHHTYEEINSLARESRAVYDALNRDALFWNTNGVSLQTSLIILLGRIFDEDPDARSVHSLLRDTVASAALFSKEALSARWVSRMPKDYDPEWLESFLASAWFPKEKELREFKKGLAPHVSRFKEVYRPFRNKFVAHRIVIDDKQASTIVASTSRLEIGVILDVLHDIMRGLENLYLNGNKLELGKRREFLEEHNTRIRAGVRGLLIKIAAIPKR